MQSVFALPVAALVTASAFIHLLAVPNASSVAQAPSPVAPALNCANFVADAAQPNTCLTASSVPTLGALFPLSSSFNVTPVGRVGIGTTAPGRELEVIGGITTTTYQIGSDFRLRENSSNFGSNTSEFYFAPSNGATGKLVLFGNSASKLDVVLYDGRLGIKTTNPSAELDVNGETATDTLRIRGGGDVVENFESQDDTLEPGTVVALDALRAGEVVAASEVYDKKVIGVVSGAGGVNPGLVLCQDGVLDGNVQVAMVGRVYVKCSAENGAIAAGDRLTTSALRGHAMKSTDSSLADGAVIGKAAGSLAEGTGLVLVVVNLQ